MVAHTHKDKYSIHKIMSSLSDDFLCPVRSLDQMSVLSYYTALQAIQFHLMLHCHNFKGHTLGIEGLPPSSSPILPFLSSPPFPPPSFLPPLPPIFLSSFSLLSSLPLFPSSSLPFHTCTKEYITTEAHGIVKVNPWNYVRSTVLIHQYWTTMGGWKIKNQGFAEKNSKNLSNLSTLLW